MYERTNYLAVGVFVLLGTVALLVVGFWVAEVGQTVPTTRYTVIFQRDVNGLSEGGPVRYMGVDVGQVASIQLSHAQGTAIKVEIDVASSTPVDSGTYASLAYQGITGVAFINLAADPGEHRQLAVPAGQNYPIIPTRDVGIAAILNSGTDVLARVNSILDAADLLLGEQNRSATTQILQNLEQITAALAEERDALSDIPVRVNESLDKLQATLDLAGDITTEVRPDLVATVRNLRHTTDSLANSTGRVEQWLVQNDAAIDSFLSGGVGETAALMTDTRAAMRELEKLGTKLRSDPSYIIYKPKLDPVVVPE